jgi:hypothetical protein
MANWNKEQAATQRLLANNFEDPKWRSAALKNAYALLSRRRFGKISLGYQLSGTNADCKQSMLRHSSFLRTTFTTLFRFV